ncbi:response regulator [Myxococcota bacterium]|nr:response regulator [Myxococcota bacterium]
MSYDVLVMDDSHTSRAMVKRALAMTGFPVHELVEAKDGAEGLAILAVRPIHLVLMDLHMPVMTGEIFLRRVGQNPRWSELPIVILTAERNRVKLDALLGPHRRYIGKPFRPEALNDALTELFGATPRALEDHRVHA